MKSTSQNKIYLLLTFFIFGFIFFHLAKTMLQQKPDGWYVGQVNLYGDLVFHLGIINKYLENGGVLFQSPIYPSAKPDYPIFADLITAQIARISDIKTALFLSTFVLGLAGIFSARLFIKNFFCTERVVFVSLLLFFLNGGLGFLYFFRDVLTSSKPFTSFLFSLPREYTDIKNEGYWWINTYLAYFLPQRTFLFAFPITLIILSLLYIGYKKSNRNFFVLAGILAGFLPLVQAHSLFLIFILSVFFAPMSIIFSQNKKQTFVNWSIFGLVTAVLAIPLFNSISSTSVVDIFRFQPGWTSKENIIWFWFKNLGLFAPMLIAGCSWLYFKNRSLLLLYLPFLSIFIISNLFIFQPWEFDNSKLLVYWYFVSCIIVAFFLEEEFFKENVLRKAAGVFLVFIMIFAGSLDIFRTFTPPTNYRIFSKEDLEIANVIKNLTPKDSLFVTGSNHNNPIPALTGRSTLVGFHGWLWSHGLKFEQRAKDVSNIYSGGKGAEELIDTYKIRYVTIGPAEKKEFMINQIYFNNFPAIRLSSNWYIYDVSNLWTNGNR